MATLLLQAAGAFAGNFIGGSFGAMIGQAAGSVAGALIDQAIFGTGARNATGPRLTRLPGLSAAEGTPVARVYGRARVGGTLIWMTRFEEVATTTRSGRSGGKGSSARTTNYSYFGNFAVGVCEGPIAEIRRIWADGEEIDRTLFTIRTYRGDEDQPADPLIVAKEGAAEAPAYKGLAYVVFERMALAQFGNRIPQFSFEVVRPLAGQNDHVRAVCLIPGSSEFAYQPNGVMSSRGAGVSISENRHVLTHESDWAASIDALQALCPNLKSVALVVAWFGDDLRAGHCTITPRSERADKTVIGFEWAVAGLTRATAQAVSAYAGKPAYGGTPSDSSVIAAIRDLKARGLDVVLYPFVMMDIAQDNSLPDPLTGGPAQPAYPWRGRITCDPAPGRVGSPDGTMAAAAQVESFFGTSTPAPEEWSYRRFILHYASLCVEAGGVDAFLVGSELKSLTRVRSASGVYPAVSALANLASDAKSILGAGTKVSYAADWTEYGAHVFDGGAEVRFPLDPLWASSAVDFIGIDAYWPLSDWRDGEEHLDKAMARSVHDLDYLRGNMRAGESFDWYYADDDARRQQLRAPISDGAYGKAWIYRSKDVQQWWSNPHIERVGGAELPIPTYWTPASKPVWFMETGCPAVDRGTNAPHVFPDPKSSESRLPFASRGHRDDLIQARAIEAFTTSFDSAHERFIEGNNPLSPVYGGRMADVDRIHVWAWDARPFPAFPKQNSIWADASSWSTGHWLNGRLEAIGADRLIGELSTGLAQDISLESRPAIDGMADGYVIDAPVSPRAAIEPLANFFGFDAVASSGRLRFNHPRDIDFENVGESDVVPARDSALFEIRRNQESELPRQIGIGFHDGESDYRAASVTALLPQSGSRRERNFDIALVTTRAEAQRRAEILLNEIWNNRDEISLNLPPSKLTLEPGDGLSIDIAGAARRFRITRIVDSRYREIAARAYTLDHADHPPPKFLPASSRPPAIPGPPRIEFMNLAIARGLPTTLQHAAVFADPWPGRMAVWRSVGDSSFAFRSFVDQPAIVGNTVTEFLPSSPARFERRNNLIVNLAGGAFSSADASGVLAGRNTLAIQHDNGDWEICLFLNAEPVSENTWRLSNFLRGLGGAEDLAGRSISAGAAVVLLDEAVIPVTAEVADIGQPHIYRIGPADRDHADDSYVEIAATATFAALKPYAPVRARARRTPDGIEVAFIRRGRVDSDNWEQVSIPLGEESEAYEADVLNGASVVRTLSSTAPQMLYPTAQELADFGIAQAQIDVAIFQMSAMAGRGFALRATLPVT